MVVAMMGINDLGPHLPYEPENRLKIAQFIRMLKTYKLARISWMHIVRTERRAADSLHGAIAGKWEAAEPKDELARVQDTAARAVNPRGDRVYMELGWSYRHQGNFTKSAAAFKKATEINPRNDDAHVGLGLSLQDIKEITAAAAAFKKAAEINPKNEMAYMGLGWFFQEKKEFAQAAAAFKKALEINPRNAEAYSGALWASLNWKGGASTLQYLSKNPIKEDAVPADRMYGALSTLHAAIGNRSLAQRYHEKSEQMQLNGYDQLMTNNYLRLKTMLDRRGVKLVCVQYPMRGLEPLRKIFQNQAEEIVFVDNEQVFKNAVKKSSLQEYFRDLFAGDFGHCTDKGNKLLADNIAAVLAREVFGR